jgi:glycosyltransferase involved in cell wall biosynthesis
VVYARTRVGIRVLHSFPEKIGAGRICTTAWHQVVGAHEAGAEVTVFTGGVRRELPPGIVVRTSLARGRVYLPAKPLGVHALMLHDMIVARALPGLAGEIDVIHTWPLGALATLRAAQRLGIPTVLERPNAHTRFAYEVVARECERIGVELPANHEHAFNARKLAKEETEYQLADKLLCPSEFVAKTFRDAGFSEDSLLRTTYGYDETVYHPGPARDPEAGFEALFVGVCAVRKGVHYALEAWLRSPASRTGKFRIAGEFLPAYERKLSEMLAHPSVEVLGHRGDVPELMRRADVMMLPSIEEGFPLACAEAIGSGCVPLVSDACTDAAVHEQSGLVHHVGDVDALTEHITRVYEDRSLLARLRAGCLSSAPGLTWTAAGRRLVSAYEQAAEAGLRANGARAAA